MLRQRLALLLAGSCLLLQGSARADRLYPGGVVATAYPDASRAALDMLDKGGNAVDAAVAAAFAAGVVGPYHNGIGGGGFALAYEASSRKTLALDFREVAPAGASRDMYLRQGQVVSELATDGALSIAVPGATAGYLALLARAGSLKPALVLGPAIRLAKEGFLVTPKYQALARSRVDCLSKFPDAARTFLRPGPDGTPAVPALGTLIRQPELARTLERIAREGASAVSEGSIARAIDETVRQSGGVLSAEDLAHYRVRWREPLRGSYRGHALAVFPPPTAGGVTLLQVLGILEQLRPDGLDRRSVQDLHLYLEALRRSFVDRARWLGDPGFSDIPLQRLLSAAYLGEVARSIDVHTATASAALLPQAAWPTSTRPTADPGPERKNTTHLSVLDRFGNAVSLTTTLNGAFGSCVVAPGTGILLNNQMDDFAAQPMRPNSYGIVTGEANAIAPGKTPLSSMSPTLVFQKAHPERVLLAVGSPGGATIPTTVLQVLINVLDAKMDLVRAVGGGRLHEQWLPDVVTVDREAIDPATKSGLEAMGHTFRVVEALGDAEAVMENEETGLRTAAADPRNEGAALGQDGPGPAARQRKGRPNAQVTAAGASPR
jgi:gamma-glutamyltranspeptidase / glutathione hydrolase